MKTTLSIVPGETGDWLITLTTRVSKVPVPELGQLEEAWFTVKAQVGDAEPGLFQLTMSGGDITVYDAAAREIRVRASSAQTLLLGDRKKVKWDCRLRWADGTVSNPDGLIDGDLLIERAVTEAT